MNPEDANSEEEKPSVTLPGTVEKIIPALGPNHPEKAQISVKGADELYKEVRIENALEDQNGNSVRMKPGVEVEVTIAADKADTAPKYSYPPSSEPSKKVTPEESNFKTSQEP